MQVKQLLSLKGKVCLVTGGAGRYRRCIAEGLAETDGTVITASRNLDAGRKVAEELGARGLDFDITREMADLIAQRGGGSIVMISSMMGMFGPDLSNYEGTDMGTPSPDYFFHKAGLINLARYLARVLSDKNIRVNAISPGGLLDHGIQPDRFLENYNKKVPAGRRIANPDDIKGLVVLLASEASAYINGENILMDGGMHC